jgi:hypothetical protein
MIPKSNTCTQTSCKSDSDFSDTIFETKLSNINHLYSTATDYANAGSWSLEADLLTILASHGAAIMLYYGPYHRGQKGLSG